MGGISPFLLKRRIVVDECAEGTNPTTDQDGEFPPEELSFEPLVISDFYFIWLHVLLLNASFFQVLWDVSEHDIHIKGTETEHTEFSKPAQASVHSFVISSREKHAKY